MGAYPVVSSGWTLFRKHKLWGSAVLIQPVHRARGQPTALLLWNAEIFIHIWKRLICTGNFSNIFSSIMIQKLPSNRFFISVFYLPSSLPLHLYTYLKWASHACYEVNQNALKSARVGTNNTNWPINIEALVILPQQVNQITNQVKPSPFNSAELLLLHGDTPAYMSPWLERRFSTPP